MRMHSKLPRTFALVGVALLCALLGSCGTVPEVPEVRYYRLPPVPDLPSAEAAAFQRPLVVEPLSADGVYNEQAILYSVKPAGSVRTYHYQLWSDPPGRLLQRRLIDTLRKARMAPLVTDRLPASEPALRLTGLINRFERVRVGEDRWKIHVGMQFRLDRDYERPLLLRDYRAEVDAEGTSIQATVRAFGKAIDECFASLRTDLTALESE